MPETHPELTKELETLLVRELASEWARMNWAHFGRRLRTPVVSLTDAQSVLARWIRATRAIEFSRGFVLARPWGEVVEVLKHEMAHQYVDEWLSVSDEPSHGPTFQKLCDALGIDGRATGTPEADTKVEPRVVDRIRKLLSLAASENQHEAEAAMRTARKLMLDHNLEEVASRERRGYVHAHLGEPTGRRADHERWLARILSDHFFVDAIVVSVYRPLEGKSGSVLEIIGTETNVQMASYVYDFLRAAAARLWKEHKAKTGLRADRERLSFYSGVMRGFLDKLEAEKKQSDATGLVWAGDPGLDAHVRKRHPRTRTVTTSGRAHADGYTRGREAGRELVLHRPVTNGGSGGAPKRLGRGE